MGRAGTGPGSAADAEVLRRIDDEAQQRRWSRDARRRVAEAWTGSQRAAEPNGEPGEETTVAPEQVAAAVAAIVARAVVDQPAPLVPDPADRSSEDASGLAVGSRPPTQLGFVRLSGVVARRLVGGKAKR